MGGMSSGPPRGVRIRIVSVRSCSGRSRAILAKKVRLDGSNPSGKGASGPVPLSPSGNRARITPATTSTRNTASAGAATNSLSRGQPLRQRIVRHANRDAIVAVYAPAMPLDPGLSLRSALPKIAGVLGRLAMLACGMAVIAVASLLAMHIR